MIPHYRKTKVFSPVLNITAIYCFQTISLLLSYLVHLLIYIIEFHHIGVMKKSFNMFIDISDVRR